MSQGVCATTTTPLIVTTSTTLTATRSAKATDSTVSFATIQDIADISIHRGQERRRARRALRLRQYLWSAESFRRQSSPDTYDTS